MFGCLITLLLSQAPPLTGAVRLASVGFTSVRVPLQLAKSFEQTFALRLQETGLVQITTQSDVANILGLERNSRSSSAE